MPQFVVLGDVLVDVTARISDPLNHASDTNARISLHPGGSASNTAAWLAYLGQDARLIGCIGSDSFGTFLSDALSARGVRSSLVIKETAPTGACVVIVDSAGERTMLPDAGANALLGPGDVSLAGFGPDGHLHVSGYALLRPSTHPAAVHALVRARAEGMTTSLDAASAAPILASPRAFDAAEPLLDLLLANADEARALTGLDDPRAAAIALAERVPWAIVKSGRAGAIAAHGSELLSASAPEIEVLDTTGAGDAFAAGLLPAWRAGLPLVDALQRGIEAATIAVTRVGAGPPAP
jgi:sugar/nucleoside kinase (ribokinase family)